MAKHTKASRFRMHYSWGQVYNNPWKYHDFLVPQCQSEHHPYKLSQPLFLSNFFDMLSIFKITHNFASHPPPPINPSIHPHTSIIIIITYVPRLQHRPKHPRIPRDRRPAAAPRQIRSLPRPNQRRTATEHRAGRVQQPGARPQERHHEQQIGQRSDQHCTARSAQRQRRRRQPIAHGQTRVDDGEAGVAVAVERRIIGGDAVEDGFLWVCVCGKRWDRSIDKVIICIHISWRSERPMTDLTETSTHVYRHRHRQ